LYSQWVFATTGYDFFVQPSWPFLQVFVKVWILILLMIAQFI